jgi:hypothetical protein
VDITDLLTLPQKEAARRLGISEARLSLSLSLPLLSRVSVYVPSPLPVPVRVPVHVRCVCDCACTSVSALQPTVNALQAIQGEYAPKVALPLRTYLELFFFHSLHLYVHFAPPARLIFHPTIATAASEDREGHCADPVAHRRGRGHARRRGAAAEAAAGARRVPAARPHPHHRTFFFFATNRSVEATSTASSTSSTAASQKEYGNRADMHRRPWTG